MQHDYDELIAKHFAMENSPDEEAALQAWLKAHADNKRYFAQMKQVWEMADVALPPLKRPVDTEAALLRVKSNRAALPATDDVPLKTTLRWWPYLAAASLAGLILWVAFQWQIADTVMTQQVAAGEKVLYDTLSDGSRIALNRNSTLSTKISKKERRATLHGQAIFNVTEDAQTPFIVEVQTLEIRALGTTFHVDNSTDPDLVDISVQNGRVEISDMRQTEILGAGQKAVYRLSNRTLMRPAVAPDPNAAAWSDRRLFFDNMPLSKVIPILEKTYQVTIVLKNEELANCLLYARYNNEPLQRILEVIAETFSAKITFVNNKCEISGGKCE